MVKGYNIVGWYGLRRRDTNHYNSNLKKFLNNKKIKQEDRDIILAWMKQRETDAKRLNKKVSIATESHDLFIFRLLLEQVTTKPLKQYTTKDEIEKLVDKIDTLKYSVTTKKTLKIWLKRIIQYLGHEPIVKWIKVRHDLSKPKENEILTEKEILKMVNLTQNDRDKAFIMALYESGCRIGELGMLNFGDVTIKDQSISLRVNGKTGERVVHLIQSKPYIITWMNKHPTKKASDPLWLYDLRQGKQYLSYTSCWKLLKMARDRAGIKKRCNPHSFRKSRASILAPHLREAVLNQQMGWVQGSSMPQVYINMDNRVVEDEMLKLYGLKSKDGVKESKLMPKKCPNANCGITNEVTNTHCKKCGTPLTVEEFLKKESKQKDILVRMEKLLNKLEEDGIKLD